jgi:hypothetical protein
VFAAKIDPAFAVKPIVRRIVSAAGTTAPLITKLAAAAGDANAPGGMPDLSALAGMMGGAGGGAGGLAGLMNNPAMQQMAAQMMQNPQMMSM